MTLSLHVGLPAFVSPRIELETILLHFLTLYIRVVQVSSIQKENLEQEWC